MLLKIISILIVFLSIAYLWIRKRFKFWKNRGFIQGDPSFPFGTLSGVGFKMTHAEKLDFYYKKFKGKSPVVGLYNFLSPVILTIDPELLKNIFIRDFQSFHDRGMYFNKVDDPISASTLTLDGREWKDRRVKLTPIFTSGKMKAMFELTDKISDKFVNALERELIKSSIFEMRSWSRKFTADNIANVAFGIDPNCIEDESSEFSYYQKKLSEGSAFEFLKFIFSNEWPDLSRKLHIRFIPKDIGDFFLKIFKKTFEYREKYPITRPDLVSLLLELKNIYTKEELAAEAFVVHVGGYETSSALITFILYELALNQDIQGRLRKEITTGVKENGEKWSYDMIFGCKYLDMVVNEGLRKYPPIPVHLRKCTKEYQIPDTDLVIPKGTVIQINAFSMQRDPEYFPNPDTFDPERFSDENIKNVKPFTNIPFGEGPRICLGMRFGLMQSKIGIAKIIKSFIVTPSASTKVPLKLEPGDPFLTPQGGMWVILKRID